MVGGSTRTLPPTITYRNLGFFLGLAGSKPKNHTITWWFEESMVGGRKERSSPPSSSTNLSCLRGEIKFGKEGAKLRFLPPLYFHVNKLCLVPGLRRRGVRGSRWFKHFYFLMFLYLILFGCWFTGSCARATMKLTDNLKRSFPPSNPPKLTM